MDLVRNQRAAVMASYAQGVASGVVILLAVLATAATLLGALGMVPSLHMPLQFGETIYNGAGLYVQGGLAALLIASVLTMPSGFRVLRLEQSHRDFSISMSDVAEAYHMCHAADRAGTFQMASEFDAVKERMAYLRQHRDLGSLEPGILELAAQMSYASRDLAETYSDENVARARGFLRHRQEEIAMFEDRFDRAVAVCHDLRRLRESVEVDESVMESRMQQLEEEFGGLITEMGFIKGNPNDNIIPLSHATAAE